MDDTIDTILARAATRGREAGSAYAGEVTPAEAWRLVELGAARLVDVRSAAEWSFVGMPPSATGIEFKTWPGMQPNPAFADQLEAAVTKDLPVLFLCRSGVRSVAAATLATGLGYQAYNILDGFEGPLDGQGQRNRLGGWRASGLPWRQG